MIDTVVFRLHDLSNEGHKAIIDFLLDEGKMDRHSWHKIGRAVFIEKDEYMGKEHRIRLNEHINRTFGDVEVRRAKIFGGFPAPSYHYDIIWHELNDCVQFQLSIPKYLFGHNIAQFVPSPMSKDFNKLGFHGAKSKKKQARLAYERLLKFIKQFFAENFIDIPVDFKKLELRRIDLCFNQYFNSKDDALKYLAYQKRVVKNYVREGSSYGQDEWTSTNYKTAFYGLKIYHKGTEFHKHDKKKLMGFNKEMSEGLIAGKKKYKNAAQSFDTTYLQEQADKILRYELSIAAPGLSYFFKRHVYRKNDKDYKAMLKDYRRIGNIYENPYTAEKYDALIRAGKIKEAARMKRADERRQLLTNEDKRFYKEFHKWINKRHEFYPYRKCKTEKEKGGFMAYKFTHHKEQGFPVDLFMHVYNRLDQDFKAFQIRQMPSFDEMLETLRKYNEDAELKRQKFKDYIKTGALTKIEQKKRGMSKIAEAKMIQIFMLLQKKSIDEIKRERLFNPRTMTNYISDLKKLQVYRSTISSEPVPHHDDFTIYYNELLYGDHMRFFSRNDMMYK